MVSCKQGTWINKHMKMVHGVVEGNTYILSSTMLSSYMWLIVGMLHTHTTYTIGLHTYLAYQQ